MDLLLYDGMVSIKSIISPPLRTTKRKLLATNEEYLYFYAMATYANPHGLECSKISS